MTAQWAVRAAKDRARSSRENRVPIETLRSKFDKAAILVKLRQRIHYIFSFLRVLRRLENIVVSRVAKATSNTPYFLRALHENQLSTVFPSLTPEVHQKKEKPSLVLGFSFFRLRRTGTRSRSGLLRSKSREKTQPRNIGKRERTPNGYDLLPVFTK